MKSFSKKKKKKEKRLPYQMKWWFICTKNIYKKIVKYSKNSR